MHASVEDEKKLERYRTFDIEKGQTSKEAVYVFRATMMTKGNDD